MSLTFYDHISRPKCSVKSLFQDLLLSSDRLPPKRYSSNDEDKKKLTELLKSLTLKKDDVGDTGISAKLAKPMHRKNLPPKPARVIETSATEDLDMQELDKRLHQAARKVAESIGGPEGERTKSDLYFMLEAHELEKSAAATGHPITIDLAKVLYGMKIVKKKISPEHFVTSRSGSSPDMTRPADGEIPSPKMPPVPFRRRKERVPLPSSERKFDLYANERLGIFDVDQLPPAEPEDCLETWRRLKQKELQYLITYPAENAYEEMIRWTDQGKLWHYPIDNEQGVYSFGCLM